jgi:hypothetical protein
MAPVPVLWWRSVGHTHTAQVVEVMIDDLARAAGKDPVAFRLALLGKHPRHAGVLKLAAEKAGWGKTMAKGKGMGIAVHESFNSFVAEAAEVAVAGDGSLKVEKVVCAVDCGIAVNPDIVVAQMEGGIGYALGAALRNKITLSGGEVDQSNFNDYEPLRIDDMPKVEVHIVASSEAPTGVGEPGVPALRRRSRTPSLPPPASACARCPSPTRRSEVPSRAGGIRLFFQGPGRFRRPPSSAPWSGRSPPPRRPSAGPAAPGLRPGGRLSWTCLEDSGRP